MKFLKPNLKENMIYSWDSKLSKEGKKEDKDMNYGDNKEAEASIQEDGKTKDKEFSEEI